MQEITIPLRRIAESEVGNLEDYFHLLHDEYASRYLEALGVTPTPANKQTVMRNMPLRRCEVQATWSGNRGDSAVADSIKILPPRIEESTDLEALSDLDKNRRAQWYGHADMISVALPFTPKRTVTLPDAKDEEEIGGSGAILASLAAMKGGGDFNLVDLRMELKRIKDGGTITAKPGQQDGDPERRKRHKQELATLREKYILPFACERVPLEPGGEPALELWPFEGPLDLDVPETFREEALHPPQTTLDDLRKDTTKFVEEYLPLELLTTRGRLLFEMEKERARLHGELVSLQSQLGGTDDLAASSRGPRQSARGSKAPRMALEVAQRLQVTSPNGQVHCSGAYELIGRRARGQPIWKMVDADRWLYCNAEGSWMIGGPLAEQLDFDAVSGFIVHPTAARGMPPHSVSGAWKRRDGSEWKLDTRIIVKEQPGTGEPAEIQKRRRLRELNHKCRELQQVFEDTQAELRDAQVIRLTGLLAHMLYWVTFGSLHPPEQKLSETALQSMFVAVHELWSAFEAVHRDNALGVSFIIPSLMLTVKRGIERIFELQYPRIFAEETLCRQLIDRINTLLMRLFDPDCVYAHFGVFDGESQAIKLSRKLDLMLSARGQSSAKRSVGKRYRSTPLVRSLLGGNGAAEQESALQGKHASGNARPPRPGPMCDSKTRASMARGSLGGAMSLDWLQPPDGDQRQGALFNSAMGRILGQDVTNASPSMSPRGVSPRGPMTARSMSTAHSTSVSTNLPTAPGALGTSLSSEGPKSARATCTGSSSLGAMKLPKLMAI